MNDIEKFKCLLEYFVAHLDWLQNQNKNFIGYEKYIKPLYDKNIFTKNSYNGYGYGQGWNDGKIQNLIKEWENYDGAKVCINVYAANIQSRATYLNWKNSWNNIRPIWDNNKVTTLYITEEEKTDAKSELEYTIDALGLYQDNITEELKSFYEKFMSYNQKNTEYDNLVNKLKILLEKNHNIILTGAPGTGKTYLAKKIAESMGCSENEIGFVQFHPSYDYTDFVEGLRPIEKDGNIGFERKDGVFKEFCREAINYSKQKINYSKPKDIWNNLGEYIKSNIDIDSSTGRKKYHIDYFDDKQIHLSGPSIKEEGYDISIFDVEKAYNSKLWERGQQNGTDPYKAALAKHIYETISSNNSTYKPFVFIIDEINRGEISKIFGELFYSIDPGYRGEKGSVYTQYQNLVPEGDVFKKGFYVPENVYIIGTMNDIDRSVESMDFAFRRRFAFVEIKAEDTLSMLDELNDESLKEKAINRLKNLNNAISKIDGLSSAYHIGASYFLKLNNYGGNFEDLWNYHLDGLLKEYLRGMRDVEDKIKELKKAYDNESAPNN